MLFHRSELVFAKAIVEWGFTNPFDADAIARRTQAAAGIELPDEVRRRAVPMRSLNWGEATVDLLRNAEALAECIRDRLAHESPTEIERDVSDMMRFPPAGKPGDPAFAFHNLPATDQYPASDPLSSWQVRHKGKSVKALMGAHGSYAGDHVELSDGGDDFASQVGIGAVISTKFTWPKDTDHPTDALPPGGFVLGPGKEALWRKWAALYREHMLPRGEYRGELYDIGFDKPEAHVVRKGDAMYYAFYAPEFSGPVELRGLSPGRHRVYDYVNGRDLGTVEAPGAATVEVHFRRSLLVEVRPLPPEAAR